MQFTPMHQRRPALFAALVFTAVIFGVTLGLAFAMYHNLPAITELENYTPNVVTRVLDRDGEKIAELFVEKRIRIQYAKIPKALTDAVVATEDAKFFEHHGVRLMSILRALIVDIRMGRMAQGGSTITQQLAKQLFLTPEKSIIRKIKEALLAIQMEKRYTKREIFELYMNHIYLGSGAYGVEAASRIYFGKRAMDLTLDEAALIAGLPRAPSRYSPFNDMELARQRRATVLSRMRMEGYITREQEDEAKVKPIVLNEEENKRLARHLVETVRQYLEKTYGQQRLYREGLTVTTTIDADMQKYAEDAMARGLDAINSRIKKARLYPDDAMVEGALVAVDPATGGIRALVGGRDFSQSQFNRAFNARRQPGSAFKPLVYLAALEKGFSPSDVIIDSPAAFKDPSFKGDWKPTNFSNKFYGPVTLRKALENSINVASVKLLNKVGVDSAISVARRLGIESSLTPSLSLALGASEVTPVELTAAYAALANSGLYAKPYYIKSVVNAEGERLEEALVSVQDAVSPEAAFTLSNMLKGVVMNGTGGAAKRLNRNVAGKTGTTNEYHDAWFVGYTPGLAAGVWVGFDDNRSMGRGETGGRAAAPIWTDFMGRALENAPLLDFTPPEHIVARTIDRESGLLATDKCQDTFEEVFIAGTEPTEYCGLEASEERRL